MCGRACVPGFFRGTVFNSQAKLRLGDTTRIQKNMFGKGGERRLRAEIRLGDSGVCVRVCVPGFFRGAVFNSQTKLRLGDTTRNEHNMCGKGGERRFRAEVRLIDSGVGVCVPGFFPKRNFDWETPLGFKRVCLAMVENDDFGPKSA